MFQIESIDDPSFRFRVFRIRGITGTTVVIKKFNHLHDKYLTQAERSFSNHDQADAAYNQQRHLLTNCAVLRGDQYKITENEDIAPEFQLTLLAA